MAGKINRKAVKDTEFAFLQEGLEGRPDGIYLDVEERKEAEIRRAEIEGREPDLDFPPATAGTPLVTYEDLVRRGPTAQSDPRPHYNDVSVFELPVDNTSAVDANEPDLTTQRQLASEDNLRKKATSRSGS